MTAKKRSWSLSKRRDSERDEINKNVGSDVMVTQDAVNTSSLKAAKRGWNMLRL